MNNHIGSFKKAGSFGLMEKTSFTLIQQQPYSNFAWIIEWYTKQQGFCHLISYVL